MLFNSPPSTPKKIGMQNTNKYSKSNLKTRCPNLNDYDEDAFSKKALFIHCDSENIYSHSPNGQKFSPLKHQSSTDRFIPYRIEMDYDSINSVLSKSFIIDNSENESNSNDTSKNSPNQGKYAKRIESLKPRNCEEKIMCFSASKKLKSPIAESNRALIDFPDFDNYSPSKKQGPRQLPNGASRILEAPNLVDDYYLNLLSWGKNNVIAVALKNSLYLWNAENGVITQLLSLDGPDDLVTSVQWSSTKENTLAVGTNTNTVQIWDTTKSVCVREMNGHSARVSALSWNDSLLSSGGRDSVILNHDSRQRNHVQFKYVGHQQEVSGLSWSPDGTTLASGGNENLLCLWDLAMSTRNSASSSPSSTATATAASSYNPRVSLLQHQAAVKALAWCPFQRNTLASGGGTADRTIRIWNTVSGTNLKCVDTGSQVCAIQWSDNFKELVSSHGFSDNQLCLWNYPSMTKIKEFRGHTSRVLHMGLSPDGSTIVSASADDTIRFWEIFGSDFGKNSLMKSATNSPNFRASGSSSKIKSIFSSSCIAGGLSLR